MSTVVFLMLAFGCSLNPMYVDGDTREALALAQARLAKHGLRIDSNPIHASRVHTHAVCFHLDEFRGLQWSSAFGLTSYPLSGFELTGANDDIDAALRACPFQFRITVTAIDDRTQTQLIVSSDWWRLPATHVKSQTRPGHLYVSDELSAWPQPVRMCTSSSLRLEARANVSRSATIR